MHMPFVTLPLCLQEMRLELDTKQEVMRSLQETSHRLCQENHPAKQTVEVNDYDSLASLKSYDLERILKLQKHFLFSLWLRVIRLTAQLFRLNGSGSASCVCVSSST